jgi:uncharacterized membrane protein YvbJ
MKYCSHCGKELLDEAVVCPYCGCAVEYHAPANQANQYNQSYSGLSILGVIFAFISAFVGLIISIVAYNSAKSVGDFKSQSLAKTGIILSAVFMAASVLIVIIAFVFAFVLPSVA